MMMEPKIKLLLNCIYGTKCLKRKETQDMKFKVGDKVKILTGNYSHREDVTVIHADRFNNGKPYYYISINGNRHPCIWYDYELELLGSYKGPVKFTKDDLQDGMVVEYRNGIRALYLKDRFSSEYGVMTLLDYTDDLVRDYPLVMRASDGKPAYDIMKVYTIKPNSIGAIKLIFQDKNLELIWEREKEEPKPKYKVGDRVKMRDNLATGKFKISVYLEMAEMAGKVTTITGKCGTNSYYIDGGKGYAFTDDMFEGLVDYEEMTVAEIEKELGYKVKIVDGE